MLISVRMAVDSLTEQCTVVSNAQDILSRERGIRDNLIRGMFEARVPAKELVRITGLSRDRLYNIANSPHFEE